MVTSGSREPKMATLILDNGACTAKIGYSTDNEPRVLPNSVMKAKNVRTRIFVGDQVDECKDLSGLYYLLPFQKGYLVNWDLEKQVWDRMFGKDMMKVNYSETNLIVTEPYFNFQSVQESMNEILFEDYQFNGIMRCNAGYLQQHAANQWQADKHKCCLIVDSGFSFTHIVPYYSGKKISKAISRINIGGKLLTNHLKEIISYRQLMVMDETYVINQVKEDLCYVSQDFYKDMEIGRMRGKENTVARDYILPDYTHIKRGYVRPLEETGKQSKGGEQVIRMTNERFTVPETLFHPSDVGIQEMGIPESIVYTINKLPKDMHPHMYRNIWVTGGNAILPGFKERLYRELRSMAPDEFDIAVNTTKNPLTMAWQGGKMLATDKKFQKLLITRQQYEEHGHSITYDTFDI